MIITVEDLKRHLNIADETDDLLLADKVEAAEDWVLSFTGADYSVSPAPGSIKEAVRQLAAHLYENREATLVGVSVEQLPFGLVDLIMPHREWAF